MLVVVRIRFVLFFANLTLIKKLAGIDIDQDLKGTKSCVNELFN